MDFETEKRNFITCYDLYASKIFRHCYFRMYNNKELAADTTQEVFLKAWNYISNGNIVKNHKSFLYKIANNLIIDYSRKKKELSVEKMIEESGVQFQDSSQEQSIELNAEISEMRDVLDKIPKVYREVLIMRYVDDLRVKDIARILDVNPSLVSVRIYRGIRKLKRLL
ncbi:MAG TPA: sigma-70 family RNA polymerase sigma factor [Patescibacteria group bacterium]|nr:sigma-70 family RNA polymerase sigma factor [Patescibacteria group bacterium]